MQKDTSNKAALGAAGADASLLLVIAVFYFYSVLIQGNGRVLSREGTDTATQFFYWLRFGFRSLADGEIPLWNPYTFSGTPFVAGIQSAMFYPFNVLHLWLDTPLAINFNIALHCFLASWFTYLFARYIGVGRGGAILAGLSFAYGAPYFFHIYPGHLSVLASAAWLPLIFLGLEAFVRNQKLKFAVLSSLPSSLQLLAGHPQYFFYSLIAASVYFVARLAVEKRGKTAANLGGGFLTYVLITLGLAAVQLLPTLELARHSVRHGLSFEWVSVFSLPPENLITLLVPDFFGNMIDVPYWGKNYLWEMSLYFGFLPLAFAVLAVILERGTYVKLFAFIAAMFLVLALGKHTPLLKMLYSFVPGFDMFRGLSKFSFVWLFAVSVIAGFGFRAVSIMVERREGRLKNVSRGFAVVAALFGCSALLFWSIGKDFWDSFISSYVQGLDRFEMVPAQTQDYLAAARAAVSRDLVRIGLLALVVSIVLAAFAYYKNVKAAGTKFAVVALMLAVIDLWMFNTRYLVTFDPKVIVLDNDLKAFLKNDPDLYRTATPLIFLANTGLSDGIATIGGYDSFVLKDYNTFVNFAQSAPRDRPNLSMSITGPSPLYDLLNVKYYIVEPNVVGDFSNFEVAFQNDEFKVYRNSGVLPRSFIVHDAWVIRERDAILSHMASPSFQPLSHAVMEEPVAGLPHQSTIRSPLPKMMTYGANQVVIEASLEQPGLLILSDTYYPGWKAFVDGKETKIYRANYILRAVSLPEGRHKVEFRYDPASFKIGAIISFITLCLVLVLMIWAYSGPPQTRRSWL